MKKFLDENFLLESKAAEELYHGYAKEMPLIDYHCHLPPNQIADDVNFENLTQIWLYGDHYKWRAMRANGIPEEYITGNRSDYEKFEKWAETVPYTIKNPLYHWTHLELKRYFDVHELLSPATARKIYDECTEKLQSPDYSTQRLIQKMKVETIVTTDDPLDNLDHHRKLNSDAFETTVLPAFRPDEALNSGNPKHLRSYIHRLQSVTNCFITSFDDYLSALRMRHDYFSDNGCVLSDYGLERMYVSDHTHREIEDIFQKLLLGQQVSAAESLKFKSRMLLTFAEWHFESDWAQQYHLGSLRNNNSLSLEAIGPNTGFDAIGDFPQAESLTSFFDSLNSRKKLARTIIYNLNPADNELFATIAGSFNDGTLPGKMQLGCAWWFLDQKDGIEKQLTALANMGLLSRFVGMLTDSRSFLSYPRHEYFRRVLCNFIGKDVDNGELPNDIKWLGHIVENICYHNARNYFGFSPVSDSVSELA
ncbi:MAG: glucuronate isomerase [Chitinophagaceae bacterium]|nr:glucuronate isomerase [Chitinophagaceae bacterium]